MKEEPHARLYRADNKFVKMHRRPDQDCLLKKYVPSTGTAFSETSWITFSVEAIPEAESPELLKV